MKCRIFTYILPFFLISFQNTQAIATDNGEERGKSKSQATNHTKESKEVFPFENYVEITPGDFNLGSEGYDYNVSADISSKFGLPSGSVNITASGADVRFKNGAYKWSLREQGDKKTSFTISGTKKVMIRAFHGGAIEANDSEGFHSLDGAKFQLTSTLANGITDQSSGNTYQVKNTTNSKIFSDDFIWDSQGSASKIQFFSNTSGNSGIRIYLQPYASDSDGDGIEDEVDNCPFTSNANQADSDNDGIGNVCDDTPNGNSSDCSGNSVPNIAINPSDLGIFSETFNSNNQRDVSGKFGLPTGSVIVTLDGMDVRYRNGVYKWSLRQAGDKKANVTISGTRQVIITAVHGGALQAGRQDGIHSLDGVQYQLKSTLANGIINQSSGNTYQVKNNTANKIFSNSFIWESTGAAKRIQFFSDADGNSGISFTLTLVNDDCDGDGNPNSTDPNPNKPVANNDAFNAPYGQATSYDILANDDFLENDGNTITKAGGTANGSVSFNPVTGDITYTPANGEQGTKVTVTYKVCQGTVCATATVTITVGEDADMDGDGTPATQDDNDNDPCIDYTVGQEVGTGSQWATSDCDGDGVTNGNERNPNNGGVTDPYDPCDFNISEATVQPSNEWNARDCDGDGVTNGRELSDNTDPLDNCDYIASSVTLAPSNEWKARDCDNDGVNNGTETTDGTNPQNPDTDGDGVNDGDEKGDGTNPLDNCDYIASSVTLAPSNEWKAKDCDNDGVNNGTETTDGTDPKNPDTDGDGVNDGDEKGDGTNPLDNCDYIASSVTLAPSNEWKEKDCDNDGVNNGTETTDGTNPKKTETEGEGEKEGKEKEDERQTMEN
ncbi:MAG: Ig-like domain-containing protein [Flavobacteriaceae bacterium]